MRRKARHYLIKIETWGRKGYVPANAEGTAANRHNACRFGMSSAYKIARSMRKLEGVISVRVVPA